MFKKKSRQTFEKIGLMLILPHSKQQINIKVYRFLWVLSTESVNVMVKITVKIMLVIRENLRHPRHPRAKNNLAQRGN